jgi:hypothetical protein
MKSIFVVAVVALSFFTIVKVVTKDYKDYISESTCVRNHIINGEERKNITTENGTCTLIKSSKQKQ